ncbi:MAG: glycosyltransferase family 25 protein [Pasteurella oralis]|uniref:glycosyltransferase family 25 protein n=1 Tax=Pasteurella oralis TaxID=1071947 RepID=UPI0026FFFF39|nr:glycosyltransferase family 25 protein [Pasteurella oralis]
MKKYLISLEKDQHRRDRFFAQSDTQDFELFSAINTMNETWQKLTALFDVERFKLHYGRAVTKGEVGCTLSHLGVYQQIVTDTHITEEEYCLICEDDALLNADFQQNLTALLAQKPTSHIILVGQSKIAQFDDLELEINYPTTFSFWRKRIANTDFCYAYPYKNYFAGTVAYLIKKSAAKALVDQVQQQKVPFWLADDFILFGQAFKFNIMVVRPLLAIENPELVSNLETVRGSLSNNLVKKMLKYPLKKLLAVLRNF